MLKRVAITLLLFISSQGYATVEAPVEIIPLAPPLDQAEIEFSGLSWCDDKLILLPQYPERFTDDGQSYFYYLEQQQITDYLDRVSNTPLQAKRIHVDEKELRDAVSTFDGFEAIACSGDKLWMSIESLTSDETYQSFVVPATISFEPQARIEIELKNLTLLKTQSNLNNMGDEAIVMQGDDVIAIHEINDVRAVDSPKARRVSKSTRPHSELRFPHIPFRITDASDLDQEKRFWVINYKYSGDKFSRDALDLISEKYGKGESHKTYYNVERLLELEIKGEHIELVDSAPIALQMNDVEGRNWEGLVRLKNRGFLLVTDQHPSTLLGFVGYSETRKKLKN